MKRLPFLIVLLLSSFWGAAAAQSTAYKDNLFDPGPLKSVDSHLKIEAGQIAPDFTLPAIDGRAIRLSDYRGQKNVVLSFVPAAWTPVCSDQWPGYHLARGLFDDLIEGLRSIKEWITCLTALLPQQDTLLLHGA